MNTGKVAINWQSFARVRALNAFRLPPTLKHKSVIRKNMLTSFLGKCPDTLRKIFLDCTAYGPLRGAVVSSSKKHIWHYFFHLWPLVQALGCDPFIGSPWSFSCIYFPGKGRVAPTNQTISVTKTVLIAINNNLKICKNLLKGRVQCSFLMQVVMSKYFFLNPAKKKKRKMAQIHLVVWEKRKKTHT